MAESPKEEYNYARNECGASFTAMEDLTKHYRQLLVPKHFFCIKRREHH